MKRLINSKKFLIYLSAIIIILVLCLLLFFNNKSNEKELNKTLEYLGRDFYENFYYDQIGNENMTKEEFLKGFEKIGIKVSLESLSNYNITNNKEKVESFVNKTTGNACNNKTTKVTIYPVKPYGKTDYKLDTYLDCEFEE